MRCAMDLMMTATVKAEEMVEAEALKKEREAIARTARTIAFCEKLGNELEAMANKGKKPEISFHITAGGRPMKATNREYADYRTSYIENGESIDTALMAEWFEPYCFEVVIERFRYWYYGCGQCWGYEITITPKPECLD